MPALEGPMMMNKTLDSLKVTLDPVDPYYVLGEAKDWSYVGQQLVSLAHVFINRSYYDLSGYNRDKLTTFLQGIEWQDAYTPTGDMAAFTIIDIVSSEYITNEAALASSASSAVDNQPVGYPNTLYDMQQIGYGRQRQYQGDANFGGFPHLTGSNVWGTMSATTADKLHITRIVTLGGAAPETIRIPPTNVVTSAIVSGETKEVFLMRQKRSYELKPNT